MKTLIAALTLSLLTLPAFAQQKSCEELKAEIQARLDAKGVVGAVLEIVPAEQVKDEKVIGSCEGGTRKITYKRL